MKNIVLAAAAATILLTSTAFALPIPQCEIKIECGVSFPY